VSSVASSIGAFITAASEVIKACWNAISEAASAAWNAIVSTVQNVWDTVQSIVDNGVAAVTQKWEQLKSIFSSPIQAVVNFVRGGDSSGADISANAQGGIYRRGAFLTTFAEDSAEAAIPLDGSARAISLWKQAGQMLGVSAPAAAPVASSVSNTTSSSVSIDFRPTVNISGNADAGVVDMLRSALAEQKAQFERELPIMLARVKAEQRRFSYE
jgi:hypothetical protein